MSKVGRNSWTLKIWPTVITAPHQKNASNRHRRLARVVNKQAEVEREQREQLWQEGVRAPLLITLPQEQGLIPADVLLELSPAEVSLYAIRRRIAVPCGDFSKQPDAVIENSDCDVFRLHAKTLEEQAALQQQINEQK